MGSMEPGLFVISGKVRKGIDMDTANKAIEDCLEEIKNELIDVDELTKVKNKVESTDEFGLMNSLNKAMRIGYFELLSDANLANTEMEEYVKITSENIKEIANKYLIPTNCSTLFYLSQPSN